MQKNLTIFYVYPRELMLLFPTSLNATASWCWAACWLCVIVLCVSVSFPDTASLCIRVHINFMLLWCFWFVRLCPQMSEVASSSFIICKLLRDSMFNFVYTYTVISWRHTTVDQVNIFKSHDTVTVFSRGRNRIC